MASRTYEDVGAVDIPLTLESNVIELHEYLYGEEDYVPSAKVEEINQMIIDRCGDMDIEAHQTSDDGTSLDDIYARTEKELYGIGADDEEEEEEPEYEEDEEDNGTVQITITNE